MKSKEEIIENYNFFCDPDVLETVEAMMEEYAAQFKSPPPSTSAEEVQDPENKRTKYCGKSTIDGSYVRGTLTTKDGLKWVDNIPVHPWSVGIIMGKIEPFKLKA